jgi:hypothetical protein
LEGAFQQAEAIGIGHINDTYVAHVQNHDGYMRRYILQRINHHIFTDPEKLMRNIEQVTSHLRQKILTAGGDPGRETLNLIPTVDGKSLYRAPDRSYWRGYQFIDDAQTYEVVPSLRHVYSAARAFGKFQSLVGDLSADQLYETIPDFHHTPRRFEAFVQAVDRDVKNRARSVQDEIEFVKRRVGLTAILVDLMDLGKLPRRVTHNDTKFNNVLIDNQTGEGICVIDLDTVMPGLSLYDFGDSVRSGANRATEDERDLSKVIFDMEIFEAFVHGYLDAACTLLTPLEIDHLPYSAMLMTFECGMRFLTDHLNGDIYFKIHRDGHNLDRCRTQFKMVQDMEQSFDQMVQIVNRYR